VLNTERWGDTVYTINVGTPGVYRIDFLLVESWPIRKGDRRFNITVEGDTVADSLDLVDEVGVQTPVIRTALVYATDAPDQTITIQLKKSAVSNEAAVIQGITMSFVSHAEFPTNPSSGLTSCRALEWSVEPGRSSTPNTDVCSASVVGGQCHMGQLDWESALATCSAVGARLCTTSELDNDVAANTGCGLDDQLVWSGDECGVAGGVPMRCVVDIS
jgi:hypothetical protein